MLPSRMYSLKDKFAGVEPEKKSKKKKKKNGRASTAGKITK